MLGNNWPLPYRSHISGPVLFTHFKELGSFGGGEKLAFPRSVVIEPEQAECLFQSARGGGGPIQGQSLHLGGRACLSGAIAGSLEDSLMFDKRLHGCTRHTCSRGNERTSYWSKLETFLWYVESPQRLAWV